MSKFVVWIENPSETNVTSYENLLSDSQRLNGFQAGQAASAIRVNTMLRQSSLISVAVLNALGLSDDNSLTVMSSLSDVQTAIENTSLFNIVKGLVAVQTGNIYNIAPVQTETIDLGISGNVFKTIRSMNVESQRVIAEDIEAVNIVAEQFEGDLKGKATAARDADRVIPARYQDTAASSPEGTNAISLGSYSYALGVWALTIQDTGVTGGNAFLTAFIDTKDLDLVEGSYVQSTLMSYIRGTTRYFDAAVASVRRVGGTDQIIVKVNSPLYIHRARFISG